MQGGGDGPRALGPGPAQAHAGVLGLDHDADALGLEPLGEVLGDLGREALLGLGTSGEELHRTRELRQPEDPRAGQVAHVGHAGEGQQVVLAQRVDRDVGDQDQLVVPGGVVERRGVELRRREHLGVRMDEAAGRLEHVLGVDRQAQRRQHLGRGRLGRDQVDRRGLVGDPRPPPRPVNLRVDLPVDLPVDTPVDVPADLYRNRLGHGRSFWTGISKRD